MSARHVWLTSGAIVIAALAAAALLLRHYTSSHYVVKSLERKLGPEYRVAIESSHYDLLTQTFYANGVSVVEDTLRDGPKPDGKRRRSWSSYQLPAVAARGVNLWDLKRGSIVADEFRFDRPRVKVFLDRKIASQHTGPRKMPHQVLMSSDSRVRIGAVRIVGGDIEYAEQSITGVRPGKFRFADFYLTMHNFGNDTAHLGTPCTIDVRTRLADSGLLNATFHYDLSSDVTNMSYRATMGRMDVTSLNKLLVDLKGIEIKEGTIDSLSTRITVRGDLASGTVRVPYHGLKFKIVDKEDHDQDLSDRFATLLYTHKAHENNPEDDDEPVKVVSIHRQRLPNVSLLKFVWETVREGALRTVGVDDVTATAN